MLKTLTCFNSLTKSEAELNGLMSLEEKEYQKECKRRSKQIERELKESGKIYKATIKLLLLGTGESGKSTILKQMRIIHISKFSDSERREKINDIKSNIRDSILSILDAMERMNIKLENERLNEAREFVYESSQLLIPNNRSLDEPERIEKLWDCIDALWKDEGVRRCAKRGNEYHLIDSAEYFLDRIKQIRSSNYLPDEQDILRCRVLTTGISESKFRVKNVNFHIFDVGGQRDQRRKWIQCFNQVTAIIFVVDISSFNMSLREDYKVNRLKESLQSFRQIWINRYLYHISIILFLNKYDIFVKKIVDENSKLEDYFPDYKYFQTPEYIDKHLVVPNEHPEVTRAKMFILEQFIKITNEKLSDALRISARHEAYENVTYTKNEKHSNEKSNGAIHLVHMGNGYSHYLNGTNNNNNNNTNNSNSYINNNSSSSTSTTSVDYEKKRHIQLRMSYQDAQEESANVKFCIPYFTCAVDTENIKRVFKGCSEILKKEHLEKSGLL